MGKSKHFLDKLNVPELKEQPKKKRGGARPGSGPKPKLVKFASQNAYFNAKVDEHFDELFEALMEVSKGVYVEEKTPTGKRKVYRKLPSTEAIKYVYDRRLGKPVDNVDMKSGGEQLAPQVVVYLPKRKESE